MQRGSVVISTAGHDKGNFYIVLERDGAFAFVCDGKTKRLLKPKRKNIKHLKETGLFAKLDTYEILYDAHIKKELRCLSRYADVNSSANMLIKEGGCYLG